MVSSGARAPPRPTPSPPCRAAPPPAPPSRSLTPRPPTGQISDKLTGFTHNAVTPFGMLADIPIILASAIEEVSPPFIWMGGGEVDLKVGCTLREFKAGLRPIVADVSDAR